MPERYTIGEKIALDDLAKAPEGTWLIAETSQLLRSLSGHSIVQLVPVKSEFARPMESHNRFTMVYCGNPATPQETAIANAQNSLA